MALLPTNVAAAQTGHISHTNQIHKKLNGVSYDVRADFGAVGDGATDDRTVINAAIDAANTAGGGTVIFPYSATPYMFSCAANSSGIILKSNVTLRGQGGVLKLMNAQVAAGNNYFPINADTADNCHLVGLRIDGNRTGNPTVALLSDTVSMVNCTNSSIRDCRIYGSTDSAVMFSRNANSSMTGNWISDWLDCGTFVNDGTGGGALHECIIANNHYDNLNLNNGLSAIGLKRITQRVIVAHNTIVNCGYGITLEQATTTTDFSTNQILTGNFIRHVKFIGINLRGSDYVVCANNRCEDTGTHGILVEAARFSSISGNVISECGTLTVNATAAGIRVQDRLDALGYASEDLVISGNIVRNTANAGIMLVSNSATLDNKRIIVAGNNATGAGTYGFVASADNDVVNVTNNIFQGTTAAMSNVAVNGYAAGNRDINGSGWVGDVSATFPDTY